MKHLTLIIITLIICTTVLVKEYTHDAAAVQIREMELKHSAPILQLMPFSDQGEPERPEVWRENFVKPRKGKVSADANTWPLLPSFSHTPADTEAFRGDQRIEPVLPHSS